MKQRGLRKLIGFFTLLMAITAQVTATADPTKIILPQSEMASPFTMPQSDLVFFGMVTNESGEVYNYYFQMQRKDREFYALAMLIDNQSKEILLFEENHENLAQKEGNLWQVGQAFAQFNPINNSWVFGVKTHAKKGFNFKIDLLAQAANTPTQGLRSGIELLVHQTGQLNGHLQTGEGSKEQFVTAPKAWFKRVWVSKPQESIHPLTGVLCQFNDGSGFYAMNLQEPDALRGAVAGWRDSQGEAVSMSQFVTVKGSKEGIWQIRIPSPKIYLSLQNALMKEHEKFPLVAGLLQGGKPGFCTISRDELGASPVQFASGAVAQK